MNAEEEEKKETKGEKVVYDTFRFRGFACNRRPFNNIISYKTRLSSYKTHNTHRAKKRLRTQQLLQWAFDACVEIIINSPVKRTIFLNLYLYIFIYALQYFNESNLSFCM